MGFFGSVMTSNFPRIGVGVIVTRKQQVLIGKRISSHGKESWQFPGGHLEFGETPAACAKRELYEETGLHVDKFIQGPFTNDVFKEDRKHYVTLFMIGESNEGEAIAKEPDKCAGWRWVDWEQMPEPLFLPIRNLIAGGLYP